MARDWEAWLATASGPASAREEDERDRTEKRIREAIRASSEISASVRVFAKGSYANGTNVRRNADVDIAVRIPAPLDDEAPEIKAKALTRAELAILLAAIPEDWRLFFEFLIHTGLRISEAIGLRWEHVDLGEQPKVKIREQFYRGKRRRLKSGAGRRELPLSPGMI